MTDLFGEEVVLTGPPSRKGVKRVTGYAAPPGTGPVGQFCRTCKYMKRLSNTGRKSWLKCFHPLAYRSNCSATDIRARAPACKHWAGMPEDTSGALQE
jgi:hypothetical protein